jgi:hypothetical protein
MRLVIAPRVRCCAPAHEHYKVCDRILIPSSCTGGSCVRQASKGHDLRGAPYPPDPQTPQPRFDPFSFRRLLRTSPREDQRFVMVESNSLNALQNPECAATQGALCFFYSWTPTLLTLVAFHEIIDDKVHHIDGKVLVGVDNSNIAAMVIGEGRSKIKLDITREVDGEDTELTVPCHTSSLGSQRALAKHEFKTCESKVERPANSRVHISRSCTSCAETLYSGTSGHSGRWRKTWPIWRTSKAVPWSRPSSASACMHANTHMCALPIHLNLVLLIYLRMRARQAAEAELANHQDCDDWKRRALAAEKACEEWKRRALAAEEVSRVPMIRILLASFVPRTVGALMASPCLGHLAESWRGSGTTSGAHCSARS